MEKKYCLAFKLLKNPIIDQPSDPIIPPSVPNPIIIPTPENVETFEIIEFSGGYVSSLNYEWLGTYTKKADAYYEHTENAGRYLMYEENVYEAARMVIN